MRLKTYLNLMKSTFYHIVYCINFKILKLRLQKKWRNKLLINFLTLVKTRLNWKVKYIRHRSSFENPAYSPIYLTLWNVINFNIKIELNTLNTITFNLVRNDFMFKLINVDIIRIKQTQSIRFWQKTKLTALPLFHPFYFWIFDLFPFQI